ncbi:glycosyltransferase [Amphritea pacifica]|uniref:Glycosyl transferase family 28 C-terminal domain-containing protein n=1 Tax=Amphritea pacifica TaxID=2811233 RepID=A0ABS2W837_9GAMM|nr:glycosyltransferase [Amphritea pacifica]MBN0987765.1 hypothetical protein [Amphritea pacifica]
MIFITVGTQLPFDRFILGLLSVLEECDILDKHKVVVQCSSDHTEEYLYYSDKYSNLEVVDELNKESYSLYFEEADVVFSHAGMGGVIRAVEFGNQLVIFPRLAEYREHRNNHQVDTCHSFRNKFSNVHVAIDMIELKSIIVDLFFGKETKEESGSDWKENRKNLIAGIANVVNQY